MKATDICQCKLIIINYPYDTDSENMKIIYCIFGILYVLCAFADSSSIDSVQDRVEEEIHSMVPVASQEVSQEAVLSDDGKHLLSGIASWYGTKFQGRKTANGEIFDTNQISAAHKTLPFGSTVQVTNLNNGKHVVVRINDRGPFVENRVIDLSRAAAHEIDMIKYGTAPVRLDILKLVKESPLRVIQVSAFSDKTNASALLKELQEQNIAASIEKANKIHRVIVKDVHVDDIEDLKKNLAHIGYSDILIRKK